MSLWRNRDFTIFWGAQTLSVAGDSFSYVAIPLLVLHATGSVAQMGLLTGVSGAAAIITGTFAGAIADRVDRRHLLIVADLARAVLYGIIPLIWLVSPQIWLLFLVVPLAAAFGMIFHVTYVTAVPKLVGGNEITEANGRLFSTQAAAGIAMIVVCFMSVAGICSMSLRQQVTPDHLLGRVTSTFWTIQRALSPLGAAVLTGATAQVGVTQVLVWTGAACVLIGLAAAFTPIRLASPERLELSRFTA